MLREPPTLSTALSNQDTVYADVEIILKGREARFRTAIQTLPPALADRVLLVWDKIKNNTPGILKVPTAAEHEDGSGVLLSWDTSVHHLDVEITEDGLLDFFYLNRETEVAWDRETRLAAPLPEAVANALLCFRTAN